MDFLEHNKTHLNFPPNKNDPCETAQNKEYVFETSMRQIYYHFLAIFLILKGLFISAFVSAL